MNTHRAVREYLAKAEKKTELKTERVELGLTDDLLAQTKESTAILSDIEKFGKQVEKKIAAINAVKKQLKSEISATKKIQKNLNSKLNAYYKWEARADKLYVKVVRTAEDLGVQPKKLKGVAEWLAEEKKWKKIGFKYSSLADKDLQK